MANPYYKQHWINIEPERVAAYDQILAYRPALEPLIGTLNLGPGLKVLDVGVTGVDINADFVAAATKRARENNLGIEFVRSEFPPLPFPDSAFDRVLCKNVLEYVDSAARTVAEMARVAVKGGVVVAIDSDWDMLALDLPEPARERSERVIAAAKSVAVKEPKIGRRLYGIFRTSGLSDVKVDVYGGGDTSGRVLSMLKISQAQYARDSGLLAPGEVDQWLHDIDTAIAEGTFFFAMPQFVVRGIKH